MFDWFMSKLETKEEIEVVSESKADNTHYRKTLSEILKPMISKQNQSLNTLLTHHHTELKMSNSFQLLLSHHKNISDRILHADNALSIEKWSIVQTEVKDACEDYQSLLLSYSLMLTRNYHALIEESSPSAAIIQAIFTQKNSIYKLMDSRTFMMCVLNEKQLLKEWNSKLTDQAQTYFNLKDSTLISENRKNLDSIFDCKKLISLNMLVLERAVTRNMKITDSKFSPISNAIDAINRYMTSDTIKIGRFNNQSKRTHFWSFLSWDRNQKLSAALEYCDRIITHIFDNASLAKNGALSQGSLSSIIDDFTGPLNDFFKGIDGGMKRPHVQNIKLENTQYNLEELNKYLIAELRKLTRKNENGREKVSKIDASLEKFFNARENYLSTSNRLTVSTKRTSSTQESSQIEDIIAAAEIPILTKEIDLGLSVFETLSDVLEEICFFHFISEPGFNVETSKALDQNLLLQQQLYKNYCSSNSLEPRFDVLMMLRDLTSFIKKCYMTECNHTLSESAIRTALLCCKKLITTGRIPDNIFPDRMTPGSHAHENRWHHLRELVASFQLKKLIHDEGLTDDDLAQKVSVFGLAERNFLF